MTQGSELKRRFLDGMSQAACTVNVVTTDGSAGRAGVTVSAMASVSADTERPSLLVCVHHLSPAAAAILENGAFCVNVLRADQTHISDVFAGRAPAPDGDKFAAAQWATQTTGAPRIVDPLVAFDCRLVSGEQVGTHHVFIGAVEDIFVGDYGSPLIYASRAYGTATPLEVARRFPPPAEAALQTLRLGCFHTFGPYVVPAVIERLAAARGELNVLLDEGDQRHVVEGLRARRSDIALLYDFDLDSDEFVSVELTTLTPYVLLPAGHALASNASVTLHDLASEPLVLLDAPPSGDYFLSLFADAGLEPRVAYRSQSFEMVRGLVGHGLGYTLLATKPAADMTYDGLGLAIRELKDRVPGSNVVLARPRNVPPTALVRDFEAQCRAHFGQDAAPRGLRSA